MTEKEKMLAGKLYEANGPELLGERMRAKKIVYEYNHKHPEEFTFSDPLLRKLLGSTGEHFFIEPPFRCDYGYNICIGENFYSNYNCVMLDCAKITIGDNVLLGPNVSLFAAGHPLDVELRRKVEYAFPITIGDDVWIGGNTVINPGVTIGSGTVIGSGSVVTKDIPSGVVAVGNPCRVLRKISEHDREFYFKNRRVDEPVE